LIHFFKRKMSDVEEGIENLNICGKNRASARGVNNVIQRAAGGRVQRGGGRVQRGNMNSRVQGGWNGPRIRGGTAKSRGGAWNRFSEENGNEDTDRKDTNSIRLNYTYDHENGRNTTVFEKGVKVQDEMLNNTKSNHKKNTENFTPSHEPSEMRVLFSFGVPQYSRPILTRDVIFVPDLFCTSSDLTIYNQLHSELDSSGLTPHQIWASWHGDSHLIANDRVEWSKHCPTFHMVLDKIQDYFKMKISATRLNWYRDSTEWKPFHHDASALKEDKAQKANLTVAVSFGLEREAAFEHAKTKSIVSLPCPNGSMYVFSRDINILWRHGILQMNPKTKVEQGRISVIAWGWAEQMEA